MPPDKNANDCGEVAERKQHISTLTIDLYAVHEPCQSHRHTILPSHTHKAEHIDTHTTTQKTCMHKKNSNDSF